MLDKSVSVPLKASSAELERFPNWRQGPRYNLGLQIRKCRRNLNLSQEELATITDVRCGTIVGMELGEHDTRLSTLIKVADALDMRVNIKLMPKRK